jgi:hypothetical protein
MTFLYPLRILYAQHTAVQAQSIHTTRRSAMLTAAWARRPELAGLTASTAARAWLGEPSSAYPRPSGRSYRSSPTDGVAPWTCPQGETAGARPPRLVSIKPARRVGM